MRRIALRFAIALITFIAGVSFASAWSSLRKTPTTDTLDFYSGRELRSTADVSTSTAEQQLLEIYHQYPTAQSNHDVAFFERVEAEDFILFNRDGRSLTKTEDIELLKTLDPEIRYIHDDLNVQLYGDGAVVTGRMTAMYSTGGEYSWQWIDVCVRRDGRWQILSTTQLN